MFFRAIPFVLAAAAAVKAVVHDVTVGGTDGALTYTPEALVRRIS